MSPLFQGKGTICLKEQNMFQMPIQYKRYQESFLYIFNQNSLDVLELFPNDEIFVIYILKISP